MSIGADNSVLNSIEDVTMRHIHKWIINHEHSEGAYQWSVDSSCKCGRDRRIVYRSYGKQFRYYYGAGLRAIKRIVNP